MDDSALERVESKRKELETSVARLRKSLRHWQTLELDYEGLREEFVRLDSDTSEEQCLEIARDFKAETLDEKGLKALMRDAIKLPSERPQQLAHLLAKRVEYVGRNVETLRRQLESEQKSLNVLLLAEDPSTQDDAGLPFGEIVEELDESGRVISAKVEHAGTRAADLADVLEKAGVEGIKEKDGMVTATKSPSASRPTEEQTSTSESTLRDANQQMENDYNSLSPRRSDEPATQPAMVDQDRDNDSDTSSVSSPSFPTNATDTEEEARLRQEMINYNLDTMNAIVAELDLAEDASDMSYDDDPDKPNLVPDSDIDFNVDSDMEDEDYEDDEEESEDEKGASKHLRLSSKYQKQMEELQKKLGLSGLKNLGPNPELADDVKREIDRLGATRPPAAEAARNAAIQRAGATIDAVGGGGDGAGAGAGAGAKEEQQRKQVRNAGKPKKKKVAFSDVLDIADDNNSAAASRPNTEQQLPSRPKAASSVVVNPVNETVIERDLVDEDIPSSGPLPPQVTTTPTPSAKTNLKPKISQFKQRKQQAAASPSTSTSADYVPTPPKDSLVADTILERPTAPTFHAPNPDAIDDEMHRRQIALEYHRLKSRKIHQQGGYVKTSVDGGDDGDNDEDEDNDWYTKDEETGTVRKVSRFKAARLQLQQQQ